MARRLRHLSPEYVVARTSVWIDQKRNPEAPWITRAMREILENLLKPTDRGIEWGSGRSTTWLARRIAHLTSVESNRLWAKRVEKMLETSGVKDRVDYRFAGSGSGPDSLYVRVVDEIAPASLDFAFVDGVTEVRHVCAAESLTKLKSGGLLLIDNINWFLPGPAKTHPPASLSLRSPEWNEIAATLSDWRCIWTSNGVWDTALWVKPCGGKSNSLSLSNG